MANPDSPLVLAGVPVFLEMVLAGVLVFLEMVRRTPGPSLPDRCLSRPIFEVICSSRIWGKAVQAHDEVIGIFCLVKFAAKRV